jgi:hypothetical protein
VQCDVHHDETITVSKIYTRDPDNFFRSVNAHFVESAVAFSMRSDLCDDASPRTFTTHTDEAAASASTSHELYQTAVECRIVDVRKARRICLSNGIDY